MAKPKLSDDGRTFTVRVSAGADFDLKARWEENGGGARRRGAYRCTNYPPCR